MLLYKHQRAPEQIALTCWLLRHIIYYTLNSPNAALPKPDPKPERLNRQGVLNPHPERVRAPLFGSSDFFDARDLVQSEVRDAAPGHGSRAPPRPRPPRCSACRGRPSIRPKRPSRDGWRACCPAARPEGRPQAHPRGDGIHRHAPIERRARCTPAPWRRSHRSRRSGCRSTRAASNARSRAKKNA